MVLQGSRNVLDTDMTTPDSTDQRSERQSDNRDRRRMRLLLFSELGLVVFCAVVFVVFLAALIGVYFPIGAEIIGDYDEAEMSDLQHNSNVVIHVDSHGPSTGNAFAGKIVRINRRVKRRQANSLAWDTAHVGDEVTRNDAVQTFARSVALLQVNRRSHLTIGENSLIVFDEQEGDPFLQTGKSVLVMMDGELSGNLTTDDRAQFRFGVNLPNSDVTLQPETPGENVKFLITVNDDKSTTVNLHEGTANVVGRDGRNRTIDSQNSVTIDPSGTRMQVSRIPSAPKSIGPSDNLAMKYRDVPMQVVFAWEPVSQADRYHIVVARDPGFADRVVDDDVTGNSFTHGALGAGTYYWRVRSLADYSQSAHSAHRKLRIVQDRDAPMLELESPPDVVSAGHWRLAGRTDEDAAIYVDGVEVSNNGGRIDTAIELQPGANIVTVRAIDDVGNLSYASIAITAR